MTIEHKIITDFAYFETRQGDWREDNSEWTSGTLYANSELHLRTAGSALLKVSGMYDEFLHLTEIERHVNTHFDGYRTQMEILPSAVWEMFDPWVDPDPDAEMDPHCDITLDMCHFAIARNGDPSATFPPGQIIVKRHVTKVT